MVESSGATTDAFVTPGPKKGGEPIIFRWEVFNEMSSIRMSHERVKGMLRGSACLAQILLYLFIKEPFTLRKNLGNGRDRSSQKLKK